MQHFLCCDLGASPDRSIGDIIPYKNKEDQLACQRRCYKNNPQKYKDWNTERRSQLSLFIRSIKEKFVCKKCGENNPVCIEFHHSNPNEKEYTISKMANGGYSKEKILNEIKKCIPLCSNCHKKVHNGDIKL